MISFALDPAPEAKMAIEFMGGKSTIFGPTSYQSMELPGVAGAAGGVVPEKPPTTNKITGNIKGSQQSIPGQRKPVQ